MTIDEFNDLFNVHDDLYDKYLNYILENADPSEVTICNYYTLNLLIEAAERDYLFEDFYAHCMKAGIENI
jgi:hypothetical protein